MLPELTATEVIAFLQHCEQKRKSSTGTRNCRLAAIRSFFSFVADREPLAALQCAEVLRIPTKRAPRRVLCYLETDELESILSQPNRRSIEGQRDHVLLALLYNTGARIQEVLSLCPDAMQLRTPAHIRVLGKGRKERICPIWPETAALIAALMQRQPRQSQEPLFVNRYREPLTSSGVRFRLAQYVRAAARDVPSLLNKRITPHTFRHYLPFRTMSP
jgi:site-specific recombinase XerD